MTRRKADVEAEATESLDEIQAEATPAPVKRGRGRPKGSKTRGASARKTRGDKEREETQAKMFRQQKVMFGNLVDVPFSILAQRLGPHWKLLPDEKTALGDAAAVCAEAYLPDMMHWYPLIYFAGILTMLVAARVSVQPEAERPPEAGRVHIGPIPARTAGVPIG